MKQSNLPNDYLFSKENGFPYDPSYVSYVFRRARKISGINKNITIHSLRRYFGTMLMEQDVSIYKIKQWLGHHSVIVTETYLSSNYETLRESAKLITNNFKDY